MILKRPYNKEFMVKYNKIINIFKITNDMLVTIIHRIVKLSRLNIIVSGKKTY